MDNNQGVNISFMPISEKPLIIKEDRELMPIMAKPKIIPIRSSIAIKLEEKENKLLGEDNNK